MSNAPDQLFKTLADPTRRAIFERLCRNGEQTVGALTAHAGISQPAVSKHLAILKQAGLVHDRHEGRQTHYSAQVEALAPLIDWTSQMAGFWESRFDDLEDLLRRMDQ
ncbi:putative transcriptional regulatory protein, ArsR family [Candidatus Filomicrobium marinum]|uniref:Transcriptional regulator, ArsR family n=2 Tax=Filomicrobium TaxID=119044 RepID=A0A1H0RA78_9HYPH|nr:MULTISPECIES: metalloregulator ArsR/SmtB family transcription factor [Filomicrobium]MCV0369345.1 metalloregulator ArsR/SmtB family transcription factor [Filomicrobium sp.]CFX40480.1 putative transcriptional regulatory protein, ArsR family [Candidatus Filomicrobium marinum]CPR21292.1 putative transcriptional regulatory protein, ArsR family [Candidatus Filomicrobium marinum]SDP26482.1 transcriptional regulator, ArsR family [Filomicrobium insigne]